MHEGASNAQQCSHELVLFPQDILLKFYTDSMTKKTSSKWTRNHCSTKT